MGARPSDDSRLRSLARASFAGWADDTNQGLLWPSSAGAGTRMPVCTCSATDCILTSCGGRRLGRAQPKTSGTLRRVVLHCPGEETCRRGGCDTTLDDELVAAIGLVAIDAGVTASIAANADWAADAYRASSLGTIDDDPEEVLSVAAQPLLAAGWEEVSSSSSELGDARSFLLSHQDQVLTAAYSPLTREITFADGYQELDFLCEILAEDGGLVEDPEGARQVDRTAVSDTWSDSALSFIREAICRTISQTTLPSISPLAVLVAGTWSCGYRCARH